MWLKEIKICDVCKLPGKACFHYYAIRF